MKIAITDDSHETEAHIAVMAVRGEPLPNVVNK